MKVTLWGTRGSVAAPGVETARYGGNTACVEVCGAGGTVLVLDAGTGIRRLGTALPRPLRRVDLLLTHLHMDHIQGLGFFAPLHTPEVEVHIWGPASPTLSLKRRLMRYLSPPLFPVRLRELPCRLVLHEVPCGDFDVGEFHISSALICHPGPTVGYRIATSDATFAYLTDHEPALGVRHFPLAPEWTSGHALAAGADLLVHDAQYSSAEYAERVGWGHSSLPHALAFAALARVNQFVPFHHDPAHNDDDLDRLIAEATAAANPPFVVTPGTEGASFDLGPRPQRERSRKPGA
ncbi:MAG: MBL fold metallo-hydrolase [Thermodesulfobacteriota bacterium]|jgi:phosphoribosyl 1,2-cyclic phosphodiesterase